MLVLQHRPIYPFHGTNIFLLQPLLVHTGLYVRDIVEEGAERRHGLVADVLELDHKVATQLLVNDGDWDGAWLILEEVTVVRGLQLNLQIWREGAQTTRGERGWLLLPTPVLTFYRLALH